MGYFADAQRADGAPSRVGAKKMLNTINGSNQVSQQISIPVSRNAAA
jgi:hypothetical protein